MLETNNTFQEIVKDNKISETEFNTFIEEKFKWLNEQSKQKLKNTYQKLKETFDKKWEQVKEITKTELDFLKALFLPENKEEVTDLPKLAEYFNIEQNKLEEVSSKLLSIWLKPAKFLNKYKNFIEKNIEWLEKKYLDKIKLSIWKKFLSLDIKKLFEENVWWLKKWEPTKNARWIINEEIKSNFDFIDKQLLPSVVLWLKNKKEKIYIWVRDKSLYKVWDKLSEIEKMLNAEVLENWDFDKTFFSSWEIIDSKTNTWNIFDAWAKTASLTNPWIDKNYLKRKGIKIPKTPELLSEQDKKIEKDAIKKMMALIITLSGWAVTTWPAWALFDTWYNAIDFFKKEDLAISILKQLPDPYWIPKEFHMKKTFLDNLWAFIWMIPLTWPALKTIKVWKLAAKYGLNMIEIKELAKVIWKELKTTHIWKTKTTVKFENKVIKSIKNKDAKFWKTWSESKKIIEKNTKLSNTKRLEKAEQLLDWKKLSKVQEKAILEAHNIWKDRKWAWVFNYTQAEIKQKAKILKDAWFSKKETRTLMENWIVGKFSWKWFFDKIFNKDSYIIKKEWEWTIVLRFWEKYGNLEEEYKTLQKMHKIDPQHTVKPISFKNWEMKIEKIKNIINYKHPNEIPLKIRKEVLNTIKKFHKDWVYHWDLNLNNILFYKLDNWEISFKIIDPAGFPDNFKYTKEAEQLDLETISKTLQLEEIEKVKNIKTFNIWETVKFPRSDWSFSIGKITSTEWNNAIIKWNENWKEYIKKIGLDKIEKIKNIKTFNIWETIKFPRSDWSFSIGKITSTEWNNAIIKWKENWKIYKKKVSLNNLIPVNKNNENIWNFIEKIDYKDWINQSIRYNNSWTKKFNEKIVDWFVDWGRSQKFFLDKREAEEYANKIWDKVIDFWNWKYWVSWREFIEVNRKEDKTLNNLIKYTKENLSWLNYEDKIKKIANLVFSVSEKKFTPGTDDLLTWKKLLWDIISDGAGVCRHRSLLFDILTKELWIETNMRKWVVKTKDWKYWAHAWNEVKVNGKWRFIDTTYINWSPENILDYHNYPQYWIIQNGNFIPMYQL